MSRYFISLLIRSLPITVLLMTHMPTLIWAASPEKYQQEEAWLDNSWKGLEIIDGTIMIIEGKHKPNNYSMVCHRDNFDLFFALFSEDHGFQRYATIFPLKYSIYTPKTVVSPKNALENPDIDIEVKYFIPSSDINVQATLLPNRHQRLQENLSYVYSGLCESDCRINLTKDGTGVGIVYIFEWNNCWFLREIEDYSN